MALLAIYSKAITIPASVIDENGHVNNVIYVQWMQTSPSSITPPSAELHGEKL